VPKLRIGCSGWNYKTWSGRFYPAGLPASQWLAFYLAHFDTVETNATFYRLPAHETFASWQAQTPDGFVMAIKASRYLTHLKRLTNPEEPIARLFERARGLGARLGPVLYQLPARLERDLPRLERFLGALPRTIDADGAPDLPLQHTIEFRHPSWYEPETFALLATHGVALCLHDMAGSAIETPGVGPFTYVRFHGAAGKYFGSYGDDVLAGWARRLADEWRAGRDVYAYFNNDPDAVATHDARRLRDRTYATAGLAAFSSDATFSRSDAPGLRRTGAAPALRRAR
jgi:uncharacterized protein YecE (DUF72 family)